MTRQVGNHRDDEAARTAGALLRERLPAAWVLTEPREVQDAARIWNGAVTAVPAVVVRCASTGDVQAAVEAARLAGLPLSVLGGGHDWAGRAIADGGLVVDLRGMRGVGIHGLRAVVGGGATSSDVLDAALPHGLGAVTGTVGSVGFTGLTLGGGYGTQSSSFGLAVDNLLAAEVVLGDGRAVWTSRQDEPDLFWALRGAGGNFGVVTQVRVALHDMPVATTGMLAFTWEQAPSVLEGWRELVAEADDALDVMFGVLATSDGRVVFLAPTWSGDPEHADEMMGRVRALGDPVIDQIAHRPQAEAVHDQDGEFPAGRHYELDSRTLPALTGPALDAFLAVGSAMPEGCALNVHHAHGQVTRVAPTDMAFGEREEHLVVEILGAWGHGDGTVVRDWVRASAQVLDPHALPGGWAVFMDGADGRAAEAYAVNAERIRAAKARYDADGIFTATPLPGGR